MSAFALKLSGRFQPGRILAWLLLLAGGLLMITPLLFMFSTSLKDASEVYDLRFVPANPSLDNYVTVLSDGRFLRWFGNSLGIATVVTLSNVFFWRRLPSRSRWSRAVPRRWPRRSVSCSSATA